MLYALFAHVLKRRRKHSRAGSAAAHYKEQRQGSAMAVWWDLMLAGRQKRVALARADKHHVHSLLDRAFWGWMQDRRVFEVCLCFYM